LLFRETQRHFLKVFFKGFKAQSSEAYKLNLIFCLEYFCFDKFIKRIIKSLMLKLYLQKQDDGNIILGDEFFDIPLYNERDWDIITEEEHSTQIESTFPPQFQIHS